jgi:hypothetical protein
LFIAVVINNLEKSKAEELETLCQSVSRDEILKKLAVIQQALVKLRARMERLD